MFFKIHYIYFINKKIIVSCVGTHPQNMRITVTYPKITENVSNFIFLHEGMLTFSHMKCFHNEKMAD